MRYFHRSNVAPDVALAEADRFFSSYVPVERGERERTFSGPAGRISVRVAMEGGHYTRITAETDQVGESEADKLVKRFLAVLHRREEPGYEVRGAY